MTETVQYVFMRQPFVAGSGSVAARAVLRLEDVVPDLPDTILITGTRIWAQEPFIFPNDAGGDVAVAVDPRGQYVAANGWPNVEQQHQPMIQYLKTIGIFEASPGHCKRMQVFDLGNSPVAYRRTQGDVILFAPEFLGSGTLWLFLQVNWRQVGDIIPPAPPPPPEGATTVYSIALDSNTAGNANMAIRVMLAGMTPGPTNKVRIRVSARESACTINSTSIGVRDGSTPNTVAPPAQLLFGSNAGIALAPNTSIYSDWLPFQFVAGDTLAVTFDLFNGVSANNWAYKAVSSDSNYQSAVPSYNAAVLGGVVTPQANRTHIIDQVQVM